MWLIDENAIIFRILVWLIPIIPLIIILAAITISVNLGISGRYIKITIGASFCQVIRIKLVFQFNPSITSGNQKWNGAAPIFVNRTDSIKIVLVHSPTISIVKMEIISTVEAKACVIKYLIDDSVLKGFLFTFMRGIMDRRLISSPTQIPSQEEDEIEISLPIIKVTENIFLWILTIKKKRVRTFINGVWTH